MGWRRRSTDDFADEIQAHLALETDRLVAEGLTREEAERAARRSFGNITLATERYHAARGWQRIDELQQDVRSAYRNLQRYPVTALVAILSIGAGIGATTSFLTVRNLLFESPPPLYVEPAQLSKIQVNRQDRPIFPIGGYVPGALFISWRDTAGLAMAASEAPRGPRDVRLADRLEAVPVRAVTANFFDVLGVAPVAGRTFSPGNSQPTGPQAILSHRLWQQWFNERPDAVGSSIWIDNRPHTVVGVMPARFWFAEMNFPVWTLLEPDEVSQADQLQVVARRPEDMSHAALAARLQGPMDEYSRQAQGADPALRMRVSAIKGTPIADQISLVFPYVVAVAVLLTLLIACANVAVLMIAQWTTREAETAVRTALGASRGRLVRALVVESVLLASIAGVLGVLATFALRGVLISRASDLAFFNFAIDPAIFLQAALITILTGVSAGIGPALFETRRLQVDPLRGIATSDRVRQRWSHALVVLEISVTMALLVVTASMVDSYQRGRNAKVGFDVDAFLVAFVTSEAGVPAAALMDTLARVPGVRSVAAATATPFAGRGPRPRVGVDPTGANAMAVERVTITPGFFDTLGVDLRAGRRFTSSDATASRTVIVNETMARQLLGGAAVGRQVWFDGAPYDVVGVVADYASTPLEQRLAQPKMFLPLPSRPGDVRSVRFLVRADDPAGLVQPVRRALLVGSTGLVVTNAFTLRQILTIQGEETLLGAAPFGPLIAIGLLLTSTGIYGVLAFAISRRARELAVRVAIGAGRTEQMRLVAFHSLRLLTLGVGSGIALTFALSRLVRAAGGGGSIYDPPWPAFVIPVLVVFVVGALATWVPTRRALRINPALLLRTN